MLQNLFKKITFWYRATTIHHMHSPFLYALAQEVVEDDRRYYAFHEIPAKIGAGIDKKKGVLFFKLILFLKPSEIVMEKNIGVYPYAAATGYPITLCKDIKKLQLKTILLIQDKQFPWEQILPQLESLLTWSILLDTTTCPPQQVKVMLSRYRAMENIKIVHLSKLTLVTKLDGEQSVFEEVSLIEKKWKWWQMGFFS